jgi:hypothetical protein
VCVCRLNNAHFYSIHTGKDVRKTLGAPLLFEHFLLQITVIMVIIFYVSCLQATLFITTL